METEVVDWKTKVKAWWNERKIVKFCKEHPDTTLTLAGGLLTIIGGVVKIAVDKREYEDHVFVDVNDTVYKLPAKEMKTINKSSVRTKK